MKALILLQRTARQYEYNGDMTVQTFACIILIIAMLYIFNKD